MKILVCGGRGYNNRKEFFHALDCVHEQYVIQLIVQGWATGADTLSMKWAFDNQINCFACPAKWEKYSGGAGPKRNKEMLDLFEIDAVIAAPGGKGTANMIKQAEERGITVWRLE